jgi:hypothetical protein
MVETMKVSQPKGTKGSLKWIQALINRNPTLLNHHIFDPLRLPEQIIDWVSPLKGDQYAEYLSVFI